MARGARCSGPTFDGWRGRMGEHYAWCTTFDLPRPGEADYAGRAIAELDADFADGAVACKIWKNVGMELKDERGRYVLRMTRCLSRFTIIWPGSAGRWWRISPSRWRAGSRWMWCRRIRSTTGRTRSGTCLAGRMCRTMRADGRPRSGAGEASEPAGDRGAFG